MTTPRATRCHPALRLLAGWAVVALAGCYQPPSTRHADLGVSATGSYTFQGQAVDGTALAQAVEHAHADGGDLVVVITASPQAPMPAVQAAVQAVKAGRGRVSFGPMPG